MNGSNTIHLTPVRAVFSQPYHGMNAIRVSVEFPKICPQPALRLRVGRDANRLGYTSQQICGARRTKELVNARFVIARQYADQGHSLSQIGRAMNRDHTSILSLLKRGYVE